MEAMKVPLALVVASDHFLQVVATFDGTAGVHGFFNDAPSDIKII